MQFYQEKLLDIFTINYYIVKAQIWHLFDYYYIFSVVGGKGPVNDSIRPKRVACFISFYIFVYFGIWGNIFKTGNTQQGCVISRRIYFYFTDRVRKMKN